GSHRSDESHEPREEPLMKVGRWWSLLLASVMLWLPPPARACMCGYLTFAEAYRSADAVFVGRITELTSKEVDGEPFGFKGERMREAWMKLEVEEPFKGVGADPVLVSAGLADTSCTLDLMEGERYVVFAHRDKAGTLSTGMWPSSGATTRSEAGGITG